MNEDEPLPGEPLAGHGPCFVCGTENTRGLGLQFFYDADQRRLRARFPLTECQQGAPGFAHGGSLAAVLDEVMGGAAWVAGHRAMAVHLEFDYRKPVSIGSVVLVEGWVARVDGRKVFGQAEARLSDGTLAVEARGIFVLADKIL